MTRVSAALANQTSFAGFCGQAEKLALQKVPSMKHKTSQNFRAKRAIRSALAGSVPAFMLLHCYILLSG
jgi:hypothetical protein